ncbi:MAG: DUF4097 family beta strand repeat-containing protein [Clostridia bacterium]
MERNQFYSADLSVLQIKLAWGHLDIMADDVSEIQALIAGDDDTVQELQLRQEETRLCIEQPQYGLSLRINSGKWLQICLRIPKSWAGTLDANTISGALCARGIQCHEVILDTVSGAMHMQRVQADALTLRSVSGAITGSSLQATKSYFRTLSGDITLQDASLANVHTTTVSGDVSLLCKAPFEAWELQTISGAQRCNIPCAQVNVSLSSVTGKLSLQQITAGETGPRISATTATGSLTVYGENAEKPLS